MELTKNQAAAVTVRGSGVLVSAAAGSGKTRVLVERLMSYVTDPQEPRDIDSFLIITFTRAAAGELRTRILDELALRIAENPSSKRLRRQQSLCHRAEIGTIHSFCQKLLRECAHELQILPDFHMLDEVGAGAIKSRVLEKLLDECYETLAGDEAFRELSDTVGAGYSDSRLTETVIALHDKMRSHLDPRAWAESRIAAFDDANGGDIQDIGETVWGSALIEQVRRQAEHWSSRLTEALESLRGTEAGEQLLTAYGGNFTETILGLNALTEASESGWDSLKAALPVPFPRLPGLRKAKILDLELAEQIKDLRERCKKAAKRIEQDCYADSSAMLSDFRRTLPSAKALLRLALEFDERYSAEKRRLNALDFSDLEHLTLRLLYDETLSRPNTRALELGARFTEIMVDEYQDVNRVQDAIFTALSDGGKRLYMVGDVKQSIYRFRLADPGIFLEKYHRFSPYVHGSEAPEGVSISLSENFRSRRSILAAANQLFSNIMSPELGEIEYNEDAKLRYGADYPETGTPEPPVELHILENTDSGASDDDNEDGAVSDAAESNTPEAEYIAGCIETLMSSGENVRESGTNRALRYGDIAVLLRSPSGAAEPIRRALLSRGIPVASERGSGFFAASEVSAAISLLTVIDNPHQDIPLISVLRSPVYALTADELADIRFGSRDSDFYDALINSERGQDSGAARFIRDLEELRELATDLPADELIWHSYTVTGMLALYSAQRDGETRRRRLLALYELAREFAEPGFRSVHSFLARLDAMRRAGREPDGILDSHDNAVTIMSIHKSKGLEYPIVFLADTGRRMNMIDATQSVLMHSELGIALKVTDLQRGIVFPTFQYKAIADRIRRDSKSEEMRILYVAMTRARERLIITALWKNPSDTLEKLRADGASPIPALTLEGDASLSHWIARAALLGDPALGVRIVTPGSAPAEALDASDGVTEPDSPLSEAERARLRARLDYRYPLVRIPTLPSKLTATELKGLPRDAELAEDSEPMQAETRPPIFRRPEFITQLRPLTGVERGTAAHIVMQYIDFTKTGSVESIQAEIARIEVLGHLNSRQAEAVNPHDILRFFLSEPGTRLLAAERVYREMRFSLLRPASLFFPVPEEAEDAAAFETEQILLQGVVDCCFEEPDESLTLIDFKTDYVTPETIERVAAQYRIQLQTYAMALSAMLGSNVEHAVLYFLRGGLSMEVATK